MKSISINGQKLHETQMLLVPYDDRTVSCLKYPKHRISFQVNERTVVVQMPSMLTLELFRKGVLKSDSNAEVMISISGKKIGKYSISDFRYPNDHSDIITIIFKRK